MDRDFKSKVDWWYYLTMILVGGFCVMSFLQTNVWIMICMILLTMLVIHVFLNTWYRITADGILIVHCSFFPEKKIAINDIEALESSVMPVSSYALSLDRLMIWSEGKQWMMISPVNKQEFVKVLRNFNPSIQIRKTELF